MSWFAHHARVLPFRGAKDPYAIWLSEIMLQQTQVKTVIPYYERFLKNLPIIAALAAAKPDTVLKLWQGLGYYTRANSLHKAAQTIVEKHNGVFPSDFDIQICSLMLLCHNHNNQGKLTSYKAGRLLLTRDVRFLSDCT